MVLWVILNIEMHDFYPKKLKNSNFKFAIFSLLLKIPRILNLISKIQMYFQCIIKKRAKLKRHHGRYGAWDMACFPMNFISAKQGIFGSPPKWHGVSNFFLNWFFTLFLVYTSIKLNICTGIASNWQFFLRLKSCVFQCADQN